MLVINVKDGESIERALSVTKESTLYGCSTQASC